MEQRFCRVLGLITVIGLLGATSPLLAQLAINFDGVASGTVINSQYTSPLGATLSCQGCTGTSNVAAAASSFVTSAPNVVAPQGSECFAAVDGIVRATFSNPVTSACIQTIANNSTDPAFLEAYDSGDSLIDSDSTTGTQGSGNAVQLCVSGSIAYVEFAGVGGATACFDDLSWVPQQVPTMPGAVLMLLTLTLLGVGCWMFRPAA